MKRVILLVALVVILAATVGCEWAPYISNPQPDPTKTIEVNKGEVIHFSANAGDLNKEDVVTFRWTATGGSPTSGSGKEFTWTASGEIGTVATIMFAVSDGRSTTERIWTVNIVYKEGFETGSVGWMGTGLWHHQANSLILNTAFRDGYVVLPTGDDSGGYIPYAKSGQYCYWYGKDSQGNYMGNQAAGDGYYSGGTSALPNSGELTSPEIDLGVLQNPVLQFASWFEIEGQEPTTNDIMEVYISVNNGAFNYVGKLNPIMSEPGAASIPYTSGGIDNPACWDLRYYSLANYIGQRIRVKFVFNTMNIFRNGFRGWFIDDVKIVNDTARSISAKALN